MYAIVIEPQFKKDYQAVVRRHAFVRAELRAAIGELIENGEVPEQYRPHELVNADGNYNGHIDFHLSDGKIDVLVLYKPHKTNPAIRLVRMGSHAELFEGSRA